MNRTCQNKHCWCSSGPLPSKASGPYSAVSACDFWGRNRHKLIDPLGNVQDDAKGVEAQLFELLLEDPLDGFLSEVGIGNQLQVIQLEVLLVGGKIDWKRSCGKYCDGKPA